LKRFHTLTLGETNTCLADFQGAGARRGRRLTQPGKGRVVSLFDRDQETGEWYEVDPRLGDDVYFLMAALSRPEPAPHSGPVMMSPAERLTWGFAPHLAGEFNLKGLDGPVVLDYVPGSRAVLARPAWWGRFDRYQDLETFD